MRVSWENEEKSCEKINCFTASEFWRSASKRSCSMGTPENEFDGAQRILKKYYRALVKRMAEGTGERTCALCSLKQLRPSCAPRILWLAGVKNFWHAKAPSSWPWLLWPAH